MKPGARSASTEVSHEQYLAAGYVATEAEFPADPGGGRCRFSREVQAQGRDRRSEGANQRTRWGAACRNIPAEDRSDAAAAFGGEADWAGGGVGATGRGVD